MRVASTFVLWGFLGVSLIMADNTTSGGTAETTTTAANNSTDASETGSTSVTGTTENPETTTANATTPAGPCPDGQDPIVDMTSCFILCPKGPVFYDSAGPKADGESCVIKEYMEGTNFLKGEYPGACNGKGRCIRVNETMTEATTVATTMLSEPENVTSKNESGVSEASLTETTTLGTTSQP